MSPTLTFKSIEEGLEKLHQQLPKPFIICVDANSHHLSWGSDFSDKKGHTINDWATEHGYSILNTDEPTYLHSNGTYSHINLTITSNDLANISDWKPYEDRMHSDHFPLQITVD